MVSESGFGTWRDLQQLKDAIRGQAAEIEAATGRKPRELIVGADVAVALDRFGFKATGEVRRLEGLPGAYAYLGEVEGLAVLTPLRPEKGCGSCQMPCHD